MRPRRWCDKSREGAKRVSVSRSRTPSSLKVDPFSDCPKAYKKFKTEEGQRLRDRRTNKDKWQQKQIALHWEKTGLSGVVEVT